MMLTVVEGRVRKNRYFFRKGTISLGREVSHDIVCDDPGVSRCHAEMQLENGSWYIRDCGSTNGTRVNGLRVDHAVLAHGDRISVGGIDLVFSSYGYRFVLLTRLLPMGFVAVGGIALGAFLFTGRMQYNSKHPLPKFPSQYSTPESQGRISDRKGEELLTLGEELLRDWKISRGNAFLALKTFEEALPLLERNVVSRKKAQAGKVEAEKIVSEQFKDHRFSAERAIRTGERRKAEEELKAILEVVPDPGDRRAQYARERLKTVDRGGQ